MTYQFEAPIACTEALVTAVEELNDFGQYTLTILGIDQNGCYANRGNCDDQRRRAAAAPAGERTLLSERHHRAKSQGHLS